MIKFSTLLFLLTIFSFQSINIFQFQFSNLDNKSISFSEFEKDKGIVIVFLLSDCPASQDYTLTLNNLSKKYKAHNIPFIGVFPGKFSTDEEMLEFQKTYKIQFELVKDPELKLAKFLNTEIVPSCYLVNKAGNTIYKGRIDDWLFALGKKKMQVTQNNLDDALKSFVNNKPIKISETKPIGCILEYK